VREAQSHDADAGKEMNPVLLFTHLPLHPVFFDVGIFGVLSMF